jgi:hypothetical protein
MLVTVLGIEMVVNELQLSKALSPMLVTLLGMVKESVLPSGYLMRVV